MYDVFLSHHRQDQDAVERVAVALRDRGLSVFLDRWYLVSGRSWIDELDRVLADCRAVAIFIGPSGIGRWQQREKDLALDRQARDPTFPVIPVLLPGADPALGFLRLYTWVDLREGITPEAIEVLASAARGRPPGHDLKATVANALASICPYRGLLPFREEDAPFFFGREAFIERLADAVSSRNFVAVVGASGSGKSSVVRAGLVPQLRRSAADRDVWEVALLQPQDRPLYSLAESFVPLLEPEIGDIERLSEASKLAAILMSDVSLPEMVDRVLAKQPGTTRLLLIVDQWEQLYTLCHNDAERHRFIDNLLDGLAAGKLTVVLTLRGDFFDQVLSHRILSDKLQGGVINIAPLTRGELRDAIVRPAEGVAVRFEEGLVDRILDDVGDEPAHLPLMEFLLTELWEKRQDNQLLHEAYTAIGGVRRAIADRAEAAFSRLSTSEQEEMRWVLLRLVSPGAGTENTRRRVMLAELAATERAVVAKFTADRLFVTTRDAAGRDVVEVGHEALVREWPRLRQWVDEDREAIRTVLRLAEEADLWRSVGQPEDMLLPSGRRLTQAEEILNTRARMISPQIREYLEASIAANRVEIERRSEAERSGGDNQARLRAELLAAEAENRRLLAELELVRTGEAAPTAERAQPKGEYSLLAGWLRRVVKNWLRGTVEKQPSVSAAVSLASGNLVRKSHDAPDHATPEFWLSHVATERRLTPGDDPVIMVSYSSENQRWMEDLRTFCELRIEPLRDPDGRPYAMWDFSNAKSGTRQGEEFPTIVAEKMWCCRAALIILSKEYFKSPYTRRIELPFLMWRWRHHNLPCRFVRLGTLPIDRVRLPNYRVEAGTSSDGESNTVFFDDIIDDRQAAPDFAKSRYRKLNLVELREQEIESEIEKRFEGLAQNLIAVLKDRYGALEDY